MRLRRARQQGLILCLVAAGITVLLLLLSADRAAATSSSVSSPAARSPSTDARKAEPGEESKAAAGKQGHHIDPFAFILLELALIVLAAAVGRWLARRLKQPSVLGELVVGIGLGNVGYWLGRPLFVLIMHLESAKEIFRQVWGAGLPVAEAGQRVFSAAELAPGGVGQQMVDILTGSGAAVFVVMAIAMWVFSNLGIVLLLFMVGLESSVEEMLQVGVRAGLVAVVGIVTPFALGFGAALWLLPEASLPVHLFLGATLVATSVGITARVFKDLGKLQTTEAKVILGAAVIDDILGLIVLAVVVGIVATGEVQALEVGRILVLSVLFLGVLTVFGDRLMRRAVSLFGRWDRPHLKLLYPLTLAFALAWLANLIGLAAIVGAYAAGLIVNERQFTPYTDTRTTTAEMVGPLEVLFAPIFFLLMGMQVNLSSFLQPNTVWLALAFILAAVLGKLAAGSLAGRHTDRLSVGIGMVPRGEVGLIYASIGKGVGAITDAVFSAVVIMVIVTTLITPPGLKWSLFRRSSSSQ